MSVVKISLLAGLVAMESFAYSQSNPEQDFTKQVSEAASLYRKGKVDEAITQFEALHKINPRSSEVDGWLGFLYLRSKKAAEAVP